MNLKSLFMGLFPRKLSVHMDQESILIRYHGTYDGAPMEWLFRGEESTWAWGVVSETLADGEIRRIWEQIRIGHDSLSEHRLLEKFEQMAWARGINLSW